MDRTNSTKIMYQDPSVDRKERREEEGGGDDGEEEIEDEPLFVINNNDELRNAFRRYRICEENISLLKLRKKKVCAVIAEQLAPLKIEKAKLEPALSAYMHNNQKKCVSVDQQNYLISTKSTTRKAPKDDVIASLAEMGIENPDQVYELVNSKIKKDNMVIKMDI